MSGRPGIGDAACGCLAALAGVVLFWFVLPMLLSLVLPEVSP